MLQILPEWMTLKTFSFKLRKLKWKTENSYLNSARVLFDTWSQLSYTTSQLRNRLNLKTVGTRKISIQKFGNNCSENILDKVNLRILTLDGSEIRATCFGREICAPLNNQNINFAKENFPHIRNILLADSNPKNESLSVDILIGANYYWSIVNNQVKIWIRCGSIWKKNKYRFRKWSFWF